MKWPWKRKFKLSVGELWHLFDLKTPHLPASLNQYEYVDVSTKEADKDEDLAIAKFKERKKK